MNTPRHPFAARQAEGTMPLYEYQCTACAHRFERIVKFSDAPAHHLPQVRQGDSRADDLRPGRAIQRLRLVCHRLRPQRLRPRHLRRSAKSEAASSSSDAASAGKESSSAKRRRHARQLRQHGKNLRQHFRRHGRRLWRQQHQEQQSRRQQVAQSGVLVRRPCAVASPEPWLLPCAPPTIRSRWPASDCGPFCRSARSSAFPASSPPSLLSRIHWPRDCTCAACPSSWLSPRRTVGCLPRRCVPAFALGGCHIRQASFAGMRRGAGLSRLCAGRLNR